MTQKRVSEKVLKSDSDPQRHFSINYKLDEMSKIKSARIRTLFQTATCHRYTNLAKTGGLSRIISVVFICLTTKKRGESVLNIYYSGLFENLKISRDGVDLKSRPTLALLRLQKKWKAPAQQYQSWNQILMLFLVQMNWNLRVRWGQPRQIQYANLAN